MMLSPQCLHRSPAPGGGALALVVLAEFVVFLDITIVNIVCPA
jgi:hypothetical protein